MDPSSGVDTLYLHDIALDWIVHLCLDSGRCGFTVDDRIPSPTFSICRVCADTCAMKFNEQVNLDRVAVVLVMPIFADNATSSLWGIYYIIHKTQAHKCRPIF